MAFPAYVLYGWSDSGEQHRPVVERSEMERGIPKQRRISADVLVTIPLTLYFETAANAADFETWVYTGGGLDWFDFPLPRTGTVVQARIVGGDIGMLKPSIRTWAKTERQVKLEYVRTAL